MKNLERTFILGNSKSLKDLGGAYIEIPSIINEVEIHNLVIELFRKNEIDKVVIEIGENPLLSLQIGYHIRLSIENIKDCALVPIFYISKHSLNSIILQTEIYSQILATKGVYFSEYNLETNKVEIEHLNGLNENEYLIKFLKIIHIQPDETVGRHSLANIWGAYVMDKAANTNALSSDSEFKKKLYFKYVSAFNNIDKLKPRRLNVIGNIKVGDVNKIKAEGKRILLIDDEASKGWEIVLRKIFKTSSAKDLVVINEKVKDFEALSEASRHIIESEKFDLYLVDLRLNGLEEDENLRTESFSGMKILKKIKSLNEGNQVIVFTASNKVWNLKALLDAGANDYYVKESPEYNFSKTTSEQNYIDFRDNVKKCFDRGYLRETFTGWKNTKSKNNNIDVNFISESNTALDIAWDQIKRNYLDLGFFTLFQSIESYANKYYNVQDDNDSLGNVITIDKTDSDQYEWLMTHVRSKPNGDYFSIKKSTQKSNIKPTTLYKISCLFKINYQKDENFLKKIGELNARRNQIVHKGAKGFTTKEDLIKILNLLEIIRNSN